MNRLKINILNTTIHNLDMQETLREIEKSIFEKKEIEIENINLNNLENFTLKCKILDY